MLLLKVKKIWIVNDHLMKDKPISNRIYMHEMTFIIINFFFTNIFARNFEKPQFSGGTVDLMI